MSEETTLTTTSSSTNPGKLIIDTSGTPGTSDVAPPAEAKTPDSPQASDEHMIPKSRFDEINNELKRLKAEQDKATKAAAEAERKALEEQNNYKALYEKAEAAKLEAEQRATTVAHDALRQRIANEAGYPKLWERLHGDDEEALKADMATLLEAMPKPAAPNLNGGAGGGDRGRGGTTLTTQQIREQAARLGVNPEYMAQQYGVSLQESK